MLSATRQFAVPSENVDDFIEYMLSNELGCGLPSTFPGFPGVFVDSIEATPISPCCFVSPLGLGYLTDPVLELEGYPSADTGGGAGQDANETCWWRVNIEYVTKEVIPGQDGVREGTWVTYERNMSGELITIPSRNLYWAGVENAYGDPEQVKDDARSSLLLPLADITLNWNFVDAADLCEIENNLVTMIGTVNNAAYGDSIFPGSCAAPWAPETLLLLGYATTTEVGTKRVFGSYCTAVESKRTLKVSFKGKLILGYGAFGVLGWNHDYYDGSLGTPGWYMQVDQFGNPKYKGTNFNNIFI